ncbi:MAG: hypothetical protein J0647_11600, partial [Campylobacteraceae bacterium]|nr:hypothetical protein [Campylobacteraceae bacterium]
EASLEASDVSKKLSLDTAKVIENIGIIYDSSLQNSDSVKDLNDASFELLKQSNELSSKLNQFKI